MVPITASLDASTSAGVEELAAQRGLSSADYVAEAVQRAVDRDRDLKNFVQVGIDAADRGELIPQEQVMVELDDMIAEHRAPWRGPE